METKERPHSATILILKERIKSLAEIQKKKKLARKTKRIDPELKKKLLGEIEKSPEWAHLGVEEMKAVITAHLNLYLELRGKEYRHNAPTGYWASDYSGAYTGLKKEFKL